MGTITIIEVLIIVVRLRGYEPKGWSAGERGRKIKGSGKLVGTVEERFNHCR